MVDRIVFRPPPMTFVRALATLLRPAERMAQHGLGINWLSELFGNTRNQITIKLTTASFRLFNHAAAPRIFSTADAILIFSLTKHERFLDPLMTKTSCPHRSANTSVLVPLSKCGHV